MFSVTEIREEKWKTLDFVCMDEKPECIEVVDLGKKRNQITNHLKI